MTTVTDWSSFTRGKEADLRSIARGPGISTCTRRSRRQNMQAVCVSTTVLNSWRVWHWENKSGEVAHRKTFYPEEPKTQGIDQSLVNGTWQNFLYLESSVDSLKRFRSVNHFWKGWKCYCSGVHEFNCWVIVPNPAQSGTWPILLFYNVKPGILPST